MFVLLMFVFNICFFFKVICFLKDPMILFSSHVFSIAWKDGPSHVETGARSFASHPSGKGACKLSFQSWAPSDCMRLDGLSMP